MAARWMHQLVQHDVVAELGLLDEYERQAAFDRPYRRINEFVLHNRIPVVVLRRLETFTLAAASYGIEYRWPLLDARLIQQWLSTPSIEKASRECGRYLHRRAIDGVVAPKVAWKPTKDMGAAATLPALAVAWRSDVLDLIEDARAQRSNLHPVLAEVIDVGRLDAQIAAGAAGGLDHEGRFQFRRNALHLRAMNAWLWGA
jgi:asparagine synthase (glutamine-hydrolysing)